MSATGPNQAEYKRGAMGDKEERKRVLFDIVGRLGRHLWNLALIVQKLQFHGMDQESIIQLRSHFCRVLDRSLWETKYKVKVGKQGNPGNLGIRGKLPKELFPDASETVILKKRNTGPIPHYPVHGNVCVEFSIYVDTFSLVSRRWLEPYVEE
ncbi:hypothetical protein C8R43DRAFT_947861 [Mycena crocata]|nr:hypothetical protein C8R43DRAFT_947861 [Mycena crocata]